MTTDVQEPYRGSVVRASCLPVSQRWVVSVDGVLLARESSASSSTKPARTFGTSAAALAAGRKYIRARQVV